MDEQVDYKLGILAYGSLIDDSGKEISMIEATRIECETPFNVEFARISSTRGNAPTLIPVEQGGRKVRAIIIILREETDIEDAKSILWRRETRNIGTYTHSDSPNLNKVIVKTIENFMNVQTVLYTSIGCNINEPLTSELLAKFAISSILTKAGQEKKDGLRYLLSINQNGIVTELSEKYERKILEITDTATLEQAIEKLDKQRNIYN